MRNPIIQVRNLSKAYRLGTIGRETLQEELQYWWHRLRGHNPVEHMGAIKTSTHRNPKKDRKNLNALALGAGAAPLFWALKDVSFDINPGEVVGIIGRNGAGKSTLLKILSRITEPTAGEAVIEGRWGCLLEVGTGFHPDLTGRENVYMNGTILGMKKAEIDRKFDEIVAFAEVEKFLDTPVKRYSSGMMVRLAFAVAAHLETEILIVDEVLAVGDAQFQKKCIGKMGAVASEGRTVLFVSHQMNAVRAMCTRCLWLDQGKLVDDGTPDEIVERYMDFNAFHSEWVAPTTEPAQGNPYFTLTRLAMVEKNGQLLKRDLSADEPFGVLIEGLSQNPHPSLAIGFTISTMSGDPVFVSQHTDDEPSRWPPLRHGLNRLITWVPARFLNEGAYKLELNASLYRLEWISRPGVNAPAVKFIIHGGLSQSPHWLLARQGVVAPLLPFQALDPDTTPVFQQDTP